VKKNKALSPVPYDLWCSYFYW